LPAVLPCSSAESDAYIAGSGNASGSFATTSWNNTEVIQVGSVINRTDDHPTAFYGGRAFSMSWVREN
jgi:hypothetical protein